MKKPLASAVFTALVAFTLTACGGGGGGGSSDGTSTSGVTETSAPFIRTYATVTSDGSAGQVDIISGGMPVKSNSDPLDPGLAADDVAAQTLLKTILSLAGLDLDRNAGVFGGVPVGFDTYMPGLPINQDADKVRDRIIGANNVYDLFQTTTGTPLLFNPGPPLVVGGPPFDGGDGNGDGLADGGPGLFSNFNLTSGNAGTSPLPQLARLPNAMGPAGAGGRGPSADDQHQFIQIEFPYNLAIDSLFNPFNAGNSFLGDTLPGELNVTVQNHRVERLDAADTINIVDQLPEHVSGVAVIGGTTSIPLVGGGFASLHPTSLSTGDANLSNVPVEALPRISEPNVLTYIAHESPSTISTVSPADTGFIDGDGNLILPDPTSSSGGGRVFGANATHPGSVNDFATEGDEAAGRVGFISFKISRLRTTQGQTVEDVYFHTFPVAQDNIGQHPLAVRAKDPGSATSGGSNARLFTRGPAIPVDSITEIPAIDVLDPASDILSQLADPPTSDADIVISTRARFRIEFDKEVVPNSVGFSRQYTIHSVAGKGIVFPFNGNTRPITSPANEFIDGATGAPLAPSVYLAVNQPTAVRVNNPFLKDVNSDNNLDSGDPIVPGLTAATGTEINGLYPARFNSLATLPRGVVPIDIYPVNQNNLQAYIIEPLVELPPGSVVTLGVCRQGLGYSNNSLSATFQEDPVALNWTPSSSTHTNHGNYTRSGTMFTPWQGLTPDGLGDNAVASKQAILGNNTVIKVNAGPMDLEGLLFFGGTGTAVDTLIDNVANDATDGGWNVSRSFPVGDDLEKPYVNVPVAPQALVAGFGTNGLGVLDLSGTGFNTNAPGGAADNVGKEDYLVVSRFLNVATTGLATKNNYVSNGSLAGNGHQRGFGLISRYSSGGCNCTPISLESEFATGAPIATGSKTPTPGVNEGSSGYETMARNSAGSQFLTDPDDVRLVRDIMFGDFLDTLYFDTENPFATVANHRTYNTPTQTGVSTNNVSDPPLPNPPPMRFPVGLPHTAVIFDQDDLTKEPFLIEGNEVFGTDNFIRFDDGTGIPPGTQPTNVFIQLNPTSNGSNPNSFDVPHLPNAGYNSPFTGEQNQLVKFVQTGPMPKTNTAGAVVLSTLNAAAINTAPPGGLQPPIYQTRQQIGNFLFVTDGLSKKLHAINSNNMKVIESIDLPDPYGLGLTADLDLLFVSNEGDNSVSVVDVDPRRATFMMEINRVKVGQGPRAVCVTPDNEDVFVLNRLDNTITIIDVNTQSVRRTITQSGIDRPADVCMGLREVGTFAFQSGTYHGFIANEGGDNVLIFEGGPSGQAGIGFDNILGAIKPNQPATLGLPTFRPMNAPRSVAYDPVAPLDSFGGTIGCFVAHQDAISGQAMISRIAYTKDSQPGQTVFNSNNASPSFGEKVFEVTQQYISSSTGTALAVSLPDFNQETLLESNFGTNFNLYNAGATLVIIAGLQLPRNAKYPQAGVTTGGVVNSLSRWNPDRVYLSSAGNRIDVFDVFSGQVLKTIPTQADVSVLTSYFKQ